jgi:ABC-type branched-subunit amino acid transport system permease subunit
MRRDPRDLAILAVATLVALAAPLALSTYWQHIAILTLFFAYLCAAWNLVGGYVGAFSFAHPLFFAAGGYAAAYLGVRGKLSPWLAMLAGVAVAVVIGLAIDTLAARFKLPMLSYALTTLAFSHMGLFIVRSIPALGGINGLYVVPGTPGLWQFQFEAKAPFYYLMLTGAVGLTLLVWWFEQSRLGLEARVVRDNERAAEAIGVNALWTRLRVTAASAALTAAAGTFYAQFVLYVDPVSFLSPQLFIQVILFTAVGGMGTLWGPILGAVVLAPIGEILRATISTQYPGAHMLVYGIVFVTVILLMPHGIVGIFRRPVRVAARASRPRGVSVGGA